MRAFFAMGVLCLIACFATSAEAHTRHHHYHRQQVQAAPTFAFNFFSPVNAAPTPAQHHWRHYAAKHSKTIHGDFDAIGHAGLVTVQTAAGISITVGRDVADKFQGLIRDYVEAGYRPPEISCAAKVGTHVPNSRHYIGHACDFHQSGWNKTDPFMYSERSIELAHKWGLVSGCEFHRPRKDCGHIGDDFAAGRHYANSHHRYRHYAKG